MELQCRRDYWNGAFDVKRFQTVFISIADVEYQSKLQARFFGNVIAWSYCDTDCVMLE
jgi:hypothetical protein